MAAIIYREVIVADDGTIQLDVPELVPGQRVRIAIDPGETNAQAKRRAIDIINAAPGHLEFATAEDVDAYLNEERDSWDR